MSDADLQAYVDGLLDVGNRSRVESFLSACPDEQERIDAYRRQNILLHRLFGRPAHRPLPDGHDALVRKLSRRIRFQGYVNGGIRAVAVAAVMAVTGAVGWASYDWFAATDRAPMLAFSEHGQDGYVVLVDEGRSIAGQSQNTETIVKRSTEMLSALSAKQLGMPEKAPNLEKAGFRLVGARTLPTPAGPAVQLLYSGQGDARLKLYLRANTNIRRPGSTAIDDSKMSMIYSQFDNVAYSLVGNVNRETLLGLADLVSGAFPSVSVSASSSPSPDDSRTTPEAAPEKSTPTDEMNAEPPERGLQKKGWIVPDGQRESSPSVIKTNHKPPA